MHAHLSRTTEVLIVRLWVEYLEQSVPSWRGEIVRASTGERMHFASLEEMSDRIRRTVSTRKQINEEEDER